MRALETDNLSQAQRVLEAAPTLVDLLKLEIWRS